MFYLRPLNRTCSREVQGGIRLPIRCFNNCQARAFMMTSSNGNVFRVTGPLRGESTGDRWILFAKASDTELWCAWTNVWANNRDAGDLRCQDAHYGVTVMSQCMPESHHMGTSLQCIHRFMLSWWLQTSWCHIYAMKFAILIVLCNKDIVLHP